MSFCRLPESRAHWKVLSRMPVRTYRETATDHPRIVAFYPAVCSSVCTGRRKRKSNNTETVPRDRLDIFYNIIRSASAIEVRPPIISLIYDRMYLVKTTCNLRPRPDRFITIPASLETWHFPQMSFTVRIITGNIPTDTIKTICPGTNLYAEAKTQWICRFSAVNN